MNRLARTCKALALAACLAAALTLGAGPHPAWGWIAGLAGAAVALACTSTWITRRQRPGQTPTTKRNKPDDH